MRLLIILAALILSAVQLSADVQWSRLKGKVKGVNGKTSQLTVQNKEGDLLTVRVDQDVVIVKGKEEIPLNDVSMDDSVTLLYLPKAAVSKDAEEPADGGVYPPLQR